VGVEGFAALAGGSDDRGYEARPSRLASLFVPDLAIAGWLMRLAGAPTAWIVRRSSACFPEPSQGMSTIFPAM